MKEDKTNELKLPDIDTNIFKLLIEYAYSGEIGIIKENVQQLFELSHYFQINKLTEVCAEYMKEHIDISNCLNIKSIAGKSKTL